MRVSSFILVFATLSFLALPSFAEPYFAVREGMRCSSCHTNRNGGGKRTDLMSAHARELLHYPDFLGRFSNPGNYFNGEINQYVSVGGDLRTSATLVFQDKGINGSVHNDKAFRWRLNQTRLDVTQALLYGEIRLIPEYLSVYIDQRFQSTTDTREAFVLFKGLPWNGYVKGGRFFLPYGLQLQDDEAFIRGGRSYGSSSAHTGFSFDLQEAGGEIGFEPGPFSAVVAVTDGTPGDNNVRVSGTAFTLLDDLPVLGAILIGGSFSYVGTPGGDTRLLGVFAGTNLGPVTLLAEADFRGDKAPGTQGRHAGQFMSYVEANYLLFRWMNLKLAFDYADSDGRIVRTVDGQSVLDLANDNESRFSIGLEPFLNRFVQPRIFYRVNNGVKSNPTHNQNTLLLEAHVFF